MVSYVIRRLLYSIVVLVLASMLVFFFVAKSGDPLAGLATSPNVSQLTVKNIRERKHLDAPIYERYYYWVKDAATNQFGTTLLTNQPILPNLWRVMQNTLQLVLIANILAVLLAILIGVYSALRQYSTFDHVMTTGSFLGLATPVFWLALMVQVAVVQIFERTGHRLFPISNLNSIDPGTGIHFWIDRAHHLVLPVLVLMVASVATYSRFMRASMLEVINSDYIRTARAKGIPEKWVTMKHAFRNALIPLITVIALNFGAILGGAVVTETVFSLDGMGLYFVNALLANDPYPVMAWLMVTATLTILFNLLADIAYGALDPRVRLD